MVVRILAVLFRNVMRLLTVCGSLQARSTNRSLLDRAVAIAPPGVVVSAYGELEQLPAFNPDIEATGSAPAVVERLRAAVAAADALLVAVPEYGYSMPGALKNAVDWLIGSGELERKVVGTVASVPHASRGRGGLEAFAVPLTAVSARIVGGEPVVRGDGEDAALLAVIEGLRAAVEEARATSDT